MEYRGVLLKWDVDLSEELQEWIDKGIEEFSFYLFKYALFWDTYGGGYE